MNERRSAERFALNHLCLGALRVPREGTTYPIFDISLTGIAIPRAVGDAGMLFSETQSIPVELSLLGEDMALNVVRTQMGTVRAGFRFCNGSAEQLRFLRRHLGRFAMGSSMVSINKAFLKENLQKEGWSCWRAENSADLRLCFLEGRLREAIFTFPHGQDYREVVWFEGRITTRQSLKKRFLGTGMEVDAAPLRESLSEALGFLVGLRKASGSPAVEAFLERCLEAFV